MATLRQEIELFDQRTPNDELLRVMHIPAEAIGEKTIVIYPIVVDAFMVRFVAVAVGFSPG